jgi:hypothetical protein
MTWKRRFGLSAALLLGGAAVEAQVPQPVGTPLPPITNPWPAYISQQGQPLPAIQPLPMQPTPDTGAPSGSFPSRQEERSQEGGQPEEPGLGPTPPEKVGTFDKLFGTSGWKLYGWLDAGYTYSSTGPGLLATETRENRFGNEFLLNELAIVLEKPLKQEKEVNFGFNMTYYAGADAALLSPRGGIDNPPDNPRFSQDFRQLYVAAHLPILTDGGVDIRAGRMGTIIGYTSALAPYRPFYSNNYQWFYAQDGAFTGALATVHFSKQLDVIAGVTMGANTFFTMRGESPCYIGQVNYWLTEEKKTLFSASIYCGNNAIFAAPGLAGNFDTTFEVRVHHTFNKYFTLILQSDNGWDENVPGVGTGAWYSFYAIGSFHLNKCWDFNLQGEWFDDQNGTRTGFRNNYDMVTAGLNWHPNKYLEIRPELRGDFADKTPAFGTNASEKNQFTAAVDLLLKF